MKALLGREVARVLPGAEQDVEQRQVGIVSGMHTAGVMPGMTLGTLHEHA